MSSVQQIEDAIVTLSPEEQDELYAWMDERYAAAADARLADAVGSGVMDERIGQALAEHKSGDLRAL